MKYSANKQQQMKYSKKKIAEDEIFGEKQQKMKYSTDKQQQVEYPTRK